MQKKLICESNNFFFAKAEIEKYTGRITVSWKIPYDFYRINLHPNPTSDILYLANAENLSIETITVTDISGKTVLSHKSSTPLVDVQSLPQGMYFLTVSAKEGQSNFKFIKE